MEIVVLEVQGSPLPYQCIVGKRAVMRCALMLAASESPSCTKSQLNSVYYEAGFWLCLFTTVRSGVLYRGAVLTRLLATFILH